MTKTFEPQQFWTQKRFSSTMSVSFLWTTLTTTLMYVHYIMELSVTNMTPSVSIISGVFLCHSRKFSNNELLRSWHLPSTKSGRRLFPIHRGKHTCRSAFTHILKPHFFLFIYFILNHISMCDLWCAHSAFCLVHCGLAEPDQHFLTHLKHEPNVMNRVLTALFKKADKRIPQNTQVFL